MHGFVTAAVGCFDRLQRAWGSAHQQRATGNLLVGSFLAALAAIEVSRHGWLPAPLAPWVPVNHFHAVDFALTLLLVLEVIGVVFSLAHSVSESVGKQFEIFSLILLRHSFKALTTFEEPVGWAQVQPAIGQMASDAIGALLVFAGTLLFDRLQRHRPITADVHERESFIAAKKIVALVLLACFVAIVLNDARHALGDGKTYNFFAAFYTLLIFSDVLLVLISLRHSSTYPVVFRNSGFAVTTVFLRLAFTAPPHLNAAIGFGAVLFACGLTMAYNGFTRTSATADAGEG
ncbi:MAG: hypothetical protein H6Q33_629 [Deltaproteobacteria bacterium]|nr:hypothetical protein [Deltaproteobacteria bacterium]